MLGQGFDELQSGWHCVGHIAVRSSTSATPQAPVRFRRHPTRYHILKRFVVHESHEDILVLVHAFGKQILERSLEHQLELVYGVDRGRLSHIIIRHRRFDNLIEEKLIGLVEIRAETFVDDVDELGKWHRLLVRSAAADLGRPIQGTRSAVFE